MTDLSALSISFIFFALINDNYNSLIVSTLALACFILTGFVFFNCVNPFKTSLLLRLRKKKILDRILELGEMIYVFHHNPKVSRQILILLNLIALLLWAVQLAQLILFFFMLQIEAPLTMIAAYMLCAILIGLLPVSLAGMGTRDLSIVYLFNGVISYSEALAIGMLSTFRYVLSALFGLPFFFKIMFRAPGTIGNIRHDLERLQL